MALVHWGPSDSHESMGVSKNRGKTHKWMVCSGKSYEPMDDLGGFTTPIFGKIPP